MRRADEGDVRTQTPDRLDRLRADGRRVLPAYLFEVKKPAESKAPWDYYKTVATLAPEDVTRPLSESECPLIKK